MRSFVWVTLALWVAFSLSAELCGTVWKRGGGRGERLFTRWCALSASLCCACARRLLWHLGMNDTHLQQGVEGSGFAFAEVVLFYEGKTHAAGVAASAERGTCEVRAGELGWDVCVVVVAEHALALFGSRLAASCRSPRCGKCAHRASSSRAPTESLLILAFFQWLWRQHAYFP
ncbi:unnamed protein product [Trypanosoma congolense IL3000]|uniref:WGS project CAEQ00000000 data, annotated contig 1591 n=1 Tax=Trypanosoma congolense (strain IL3000) TaxID=1068625 RepID=F9W7D4_TRYCI|nr:unnamed protein product [Trypanosoma congolense IL3000]